MSLLQILFFFLNGFLLEAEEGKMKPKSIIDLFLILTTTRWWTVGRSRVYTTGRTRALKAVGGKFLTSWGSREEDRG